MFLLSLALSSCWSDKRDQILQDFTALNDSLEMLKTRMDSVNDPRANTLSMVELGCADLVMRADSLHWDADKLVQDLDTMKFMLLKGEAGDPEVGDRVFAENNTGPRLFDTITAFHRSAMARSADAKGRASVEALARESFGFASADDWRKASFSKLPRVAIITILSKLQSDIRRTEFECADSMVRSCLERTKK